MILAAVNILKNNLLIITVSFYRFFHKIIIKTKVWTFKNIPEVYYIDWIREYGSTLYVGMPRKKNGRPYISIAIDDLKSLVIYTDRF